MRTLTFLLLLAVSSFKHQGTTGYTAITRTTSLTNADTNYFELKDTTSTSARINSDSVFLPVTSSVSQASILSACLIETDTLADTLYCRIDHGTPYKFPVVKGANSITINWTPAKIYKPEAFCFYVGLKRTSGSRTATKQRYMFNYTLN